MRRLETEHLLLRGWKATDLEALHAYACDPAVMCPANRTPSADRDASRRMLDSLIAAEAAWAIVLSGDRRVQTHPRQQPRKVQ